MRDPYFESLGRCKFFYNVTSVKATVGAVSDTHTPVATQFDLKTINTLIGNT